MLKRLLKTFLIIVIITLCIPVKTNAEEPQVSIIAEIPAGQDETSAKYQKYSACPEGPQDFYIYDGKTYLLDSENERILVYSGNKFENSIDLGAYCTIMEILDGEIYVLAYTKGAVLRYSLEGELLGTYPLGIDTARVIGITKIKSGNGTVAIINSAGQTLSFANSISGFSTVRTEIPLVQTSVTNSKEYDLDGFLIQEYMTDQDGDFALLHRYNNQSDHLIGETYAVRLNASDEPIEYYKIDSEDWTVIPNRYFRIIDDSAYLLCCYKDKVVIQQLLFSKEVMDSALEKERTDSVLGNLDQRISKTDNKKINSSSDNINNRNSAGQRIYPILWI